MINYQLLKEEEIDDYYNFLTKYFPQLEIRSYEDTCLHLKNDNIVEVNKNNNEFISIVSYYKLDKYIYIEYLAVNSKYQSIGLGSKTLKYLQNKYSNIILEVELIEDEITKRRVDFYKRNNFKYNEQEYWIGPINKELNKKVELKLMSYPSKLNDIEFKNIYNLISSVYK
ncbi:MAG: GNAT family N-acetyltransferase [Thomasclavelia sp.]|nr:GNAT family N-acetyltransferase [Thomasclavelia sp.]